MLCCADVDVDADANADADADASANIVAAGDVNAYARASTCIRARFLRLVCLRAFGIQMQPSVYLCVCAPASVCECVCVCIPAPD